MARKKTDETEEVKEETTTEPKTRTTRRKPVPEPPTEEDVKASTGETEESTEKTEEEAMKETAEVTPEDAPNAPLEASEEAPPAEEPDAEETEDAPSPTSDTNLAERAVDVALGFGVLSLEAIERTATRVGEIVTDLPGYLSEVEAKGRPVREKMGEWFKFDFPTNADAYESASEAAGGTSEETRDTENRDDTNGTQSTPPPPAPARPSKPRVADDEIAALENRVRELEQQVASEYDLEEQSNGS